MWRCSLHTSKKIFKRFLKLPESLLAEQITVTYCFFHIVLNICTITNFSHNFADASEANDKISTTP